MDESSLVEIVSTVDRYIRAESSFTGPLPSPKTLEEYKKVSPEILELIITNYKNEGDHRREIEKKLANNGIIMSKLGLVSAFVISMTFASLGFYAILQGHDLAGASLCGGGLVSIVIAFLHHTSSSKK